VIDYWGDDSFGDEPIEVIPADNTPESARESHASLEDNNLSAIRDEEPTPKPITYREQESVREIDQIADDFSDDPIVHGKAPVVETGLRQGGEFHFKNLLRNQVDEEVEGSDNQLDDVDENDKKRDVTQSVDYLSPSKLTVHSNDSDEVWHAKDGLIPNVERLIEDVLLRETDKLIAEHKKQ
jgi:hypothetical protein